MRSFSNTHISAEEPCIEICNDYPIWAKFGNVSSPAGLIALTIFAAITIMPHV